MNFEESNKQKSEAIASARQVMDSTPYKGDMLYTALVDDGEIKLKKYQFLGLYRADGATQDCWSMQEILEFPEHPRKFVTSPDPRKRSYQDSKLAAYQRLANQLVNGAMMNRDEAARLEAAARQCEMYRDEVMTILDSLAKGVKDGA